MNSMRDSSEEIAYFTSILMFSLNEYGRQKEKYFNDNKILYRGDQMNLSSLLLYERAKGKVIAFKTFITVTTDLKIAERFARNTKSNQFSVMYYIKNIHLNNWISSGIDINEISRYKKEKEWYFLPFSFFIITDVKIDIKEQKAEIFLETIGKEKILEEEIQKGKHIQYNKILKIMESK